MTIRMFKEKVKPQGKDERVAYKINTLPWGGDPSNVVVAVTLRGVDVSDDHLEGDVSIVLDTITTPLVIALAPGNRYQLEVRWDSQSNTFEAFGWIAGEA